MKINTQIDQITQKHSRLSFPELFEHCCSFHMLYVDSMKFPRVHVHNKRTNGAFEVDFQNFCLAMFSDQNQNKLLFFYSWNITVYHKTNQPSLYSFASHFPSIKHIAFKIRFVGLLNSCKPQSLYPHVAEVLCVTHREVFQLRGHVKAHYINQITAPSVRLYWACAENGTYCIYARDEQRHNLNQDLSPCSYS